ncbi:uncharacterized protein AB675_10736 [Cyphellophora attinorum]|uniref:Uncharacterized protein n=1 Tax=Cyphellophora attinorum TaxID=1664694 RepID=A0A0N1H595_9EURO|nr:uncharacterized protein AB675_10736 [Phialophora attinorum]KPI40822.1 hypothetical protein AB675_10736 [Phialophora attinorum]
MLFSPLPGGLWLVQTLSVLPTRLFIPRDREWQQVLAEEEGKKEQKGLKRKADEPKEEAVRYAEGLDELVLADEDY